MNSKIDLANAIANENSPSKEQSFTITPQPLRTSTTALQGSDYVAVIVK